MTGRYVEALDRLEAVIDALPIGIRVTFAQTGGGWTEPMREPVELLRLLVVADVRLRDLLGQRLFESLDAADTISRKALTRIVFSANIDLSVGAPIWEGFAAVCAAIEGDSQERPLEE